MFSRRTVAIVGVAVTVALATYWIAGSRTAVFTAEVVLSGVDSEAMAAQFSAGDIDIAVSPDDPVVRVAAVASTAQGAKDKAVDAAKQIAAQGGFVGKVGTATVVDRQTSAPRRAAALAFFGTLLVGFVASRTRRPESPDPPPAEIPETVLLGIDVHAIDERSCVAFVAGEIEAGRGGRVATLNLDHLRRACQDRDYRRLVEGSTLRVADGKPLVWASWLASRRLPGRVAGADLIWSLSRAVGGGVFLLGGDDDAAERSADALRLINPNLTLYSMSPEVAIRPSPTDVAAMAEAIGAAQPVVVFVALGSPKQERLIDLLCESLGDDAASIWWLGVGIRFSYVSGSMRRAPAWMRQCGLQWRYRVVHEPRRLSRRYLVYGVPFFGRLMSHSARRGVARRWAV